MRFLEYLNPGWFTNPPWTFLDYPRRLFPLKRLVIPVLWLGRLKLRFFSLQPPLDSSQPRLSFHATIIFILSAIQAVSGFGLAVIHGYNSAIQMMKHVNESLNHTADQADRPPTEHPSSYNHRNLKTTIRFIIPLLCVLSTR